MLLSTGRDPSNPWSFEEIILQRFERLRFSDLCGWKHYYLEWIHCFFWKTSHLRFPMMEDCWHGGSSFCAIIRRLFFSTDYLVRLVFFTDNVASLIKAGQFWCPLVREHWKAWQCCQSRSSLLQDLLVRSNQAISLFISQLLQLGLYCSLGFSLCQKFRKSA